MTEAKQGSYRIGAVSRLTGVPTETLRVWERRYQVVTPDRSQGRNRLYSQHDVARLELIKRLVSNGDAIGAVAQLGLEQLTERAQELGRAGQAPASESGPWRVAVCGRTLATQLATLEADEQRDGLLLTAVFANDEDLTANVGVEEIDVLVVERATLNDASAAELKLLAQQLGVQRVIVVYGFASRAVVAAVEQRGLTAVRFPVSWAELRLICRAPTGQSDAGDEPRELASYLADPIPARRFTDADLAKLVQMSNSLKCECPQHLSELVMALSRFEQYSAECGFASREDAALHSYLHVVTAGARRQMEEALQRLLELEDLTV